MTNHADTDQNQPNTPVDQHTEGPADEAEEAQVSQKHSDRALAREAKQKRLEAQLRTNLRRRKAQSRARKD